MNKEEFDFQEILNQLSKGEDYKHKIRAQQAAQLQATLAQQAALNSLASTSNTITGTSTNTAASSYTASSIAETVSIGDYKFNAQELGVLLDYLSRKHKEEFPECYI